MRSKRCEWTCKTTRLFIWN